VLSYKQLTLEQRYQIYGLLKAGYTNSKIAIEIEVDKSTVGREKQRNKGPGQYEPKKAQK